MDEPLGALDKKLREAMQIELKHIQQQMGITVVFVTHDQEEALTMSDRVAVMRDGRLEQVGSAHDLYERPANRFVADFIGETQFSGSYRGSKRHGPHQLGATPSTCPPAAWGRVAARCCCPFGRKKIFFQDASVRDDACVHGKVTEILYMGDITKYVIDLGNQSSVVVKQHNRQGIRQPAVGDMVAIAWHRENCVVLTP